MVNFYKTAAWQELRVRTIARDGGVCRMCGVLVRGGRDHPRSAVIDHIQPHGGDFELFHDPDNLWLVCKEHHDGPCQQIERDGEDIPARKLAWRPMDHDATGRPLDPDHPWNGGENG